MGLSNAMADGSKPHSRSQAAGGWRSGPAQFALALDLKLPILQKKAGLYAITYIYNLELGSGLPVFHCPPASHMCGMVC
jgi:hypothetical protein